MRRRRVRAEERRPKVDVDNRAPVGGAEIGKRPLHINRRHVDQDVQAAERFHHRLHERFAGIRVGEVRLEGCRPATGAPHPLGGGFGLLARPRVARRDVSAARGEFAGDHLTDALAARNQSDLVG